MSSETRGRSRRGLSYDVLVDLCDDRIGGGRRAQPRPDSSVSVPVARRHRAVRWWSLVVRMAGPWCSVTAASTAGCMGGCCVGCAGAKPGLPSARPRARGPADRAGRSYPPAPGDALPVSGCGPPADRRASPLLRQGVPVVSESEPGRTDASHAAGSGRRAAAVPVSPRRDRQTGSGRRLCAAG